MTTMRAIQVHQFGGPEVLQVERIPRPEPQEGEVLIRVYAAGVLPIDGYIRKGLMAGIQPKSFPYIPGTAFAGVIEKLGPGVTGWEVGQAVCGRAPNGTYAEYTTVQTNPPHASPNTEGARFSAAISPLALKPKTLGFDEAAALSGGATTAWTSLFEDGNVQAGQRVLIHAAAGGVGLFAVQFARWKGAQVIGTASTANLDFVRSLGAETVIDYTTTAFDEVVRDVDFVLDTVGGETLRRSLKVLKRGGTLVTVMEPAPVELAEQLGVHAIKNAVFPNSKHLKKIVELIDEGHARPAIQQIFSLDEAPQAHALCETGHGRGRIILHIAD
uniref:NADPH:quinone reductase n=1 Tax=Thermosporothrix sp. COM3 TaxID=2490863 RepID=A0A455SIX1_9CHLR|nr:NADPH:quinone reductase [Thermosporothrix sp. COM3]